MEDQVAVWAEGAVTVRAAVERYGISRSALYRALRAGELEGSFRHGRRLISVSSLCAYLEAGRGRKGPEPG